MPKRASFLLALMLLASREAFAQSPNNARMLSTPNTVTGTPYSFVAADTTRVVVFNSASAIAASLPNGATFGFGAGTMLSVVNLGAGAVTITCSSCTINGAGTLILSQNQGVDLYGGYGSPAVNYAALSSPSGTTVALLGGVNTFTNSNTFTQQIVSTVATGTAPFSIASTTQVANLNASLLGGLAAPASAIVGLTDTQALQNKTFDISANTLRNSSNTAGHYLRNNGAQYVDNTIQAADLPATTSPCSGVQLAVGLNSGGTSNCATPPTFGASGGSHAVGYVPDPGSSAGTIRFLREDATWQVPPGGNSTVYNTTASATAATIGSTTMVTAPASDTNYTFSAMLAQTGATSGCSTQPSFQIEIVFTDAFTGASRTALPLVNQLGNSGTFNNAQSFAAALSVATTYSTHLALRAKASTTVSYTVVYSAGVGCGTGANYSIAPVLVQD